MRIGALEAGGTKMVCAVGDETGAVLERVKIPTTAPEETIAAMLEAERIAKDPNVKHYSDVEEALRELKR